MQLTIEQAAVKLGKSPRQIRYLIRQGELPASKQGNMWFIDDAALARAPEQQELESRKVENLRAAVEDALAPGRPARRRYSLRDLKAFQLALPIYREATSALGPEHAACAALRRGFEQLARGCHRFQHVDKAAAYREARDAFSQAACELALADLPAAQACLPGRGPQRAVLRHLAFMRRRHLRVALDVARYFPSIDHGIALEILSRRIGDQRTRALLALLLEHGAGVYRTRLAREILGVLGSEGRGLPIGSCLSQWLANLYLDGVDHFVKRVLKVPAYLRYMDDLVLFDDDRARLEDAREAVTAWLAEHRRLGLGPSVVAEAREPCTFLGYRVSPAGLSPGRKMRRRMPLRVRAAARRGPRALERTVRSYRALVVFG